jgi:serine/threonine protein kinase
MSKALGILQKFHVVHGDINPENILYDKNKNQFCLIDFGEASFEGYQAELYTKTIFYVPPEIILGNPLSNKVDLWSYGCVIYEFI